MGCGPCFGNGSSSSDENSNAIAEESPGPVVVELFSSLGCGTSPQGELLLSRVGRGDFNLEMPVILLNYHVDYWDHMGWKDPFGSSLWTVRQKAYIEALQLDTMFTPQVVVQGKDQCMANEEDTLLSCIKSAPRYPGLALQATFERPSKDILKVSLAGHLKTNVDSHGIDIMVALYENGLVTDCENGANIGRVLANDFVVRKLEKFSSVKGISAKKTVSKTLEFTLWEGFNSNKCGIAVFLQQSDSHHIFGSQDFKLPDNLEV